MKKSTAAVAGAFTFLIFLVSPAHALRVIVARIFLGEVHVIGLQAARNANIRWEGAVVTRANTGGVFSFETTKLPQDCVGDLSDGVTTIRVVVSECTVQQGGGLLATGQTTAFRVDKNNGTGLENVPDDGTLQLGAALQYVDNGDGTVTDLNTGLMWEAKCSVCGGLHDVDNTYQWSGNGSTETIWDWLDDINAEGGTGLAEHNDWRIPNLRELLSIADYGLANTAIDPIFGPTAVAVYWSSTTFAIGTSIAWYVHFGVGVADYHRKTNLSRVRAVRGP